MSTRDFTANVISATPVVPDGNFKDSKASGVWDINEALDLIKGGNWPNAANISPSAFVDALFSCDLYEGNGDQQTITNGIDLSNNGGMIWFKNRTLAEDPMIVDTVRGGSKDLYPNEANGEDTDGSIASFNSNGFTFLDAANKRQNFNGYSYVSWTFRKQPKFFDIVTYTGTSSLRTVSHNLGSVPGMIMIKCLSHGSSNWRVYHRGVNAGSNPEEYVLILNGQNEKGNNDSMFNDTAPTSTEFTVAGDDDVNDFNDEYVAYLFAHNDNDGGFGPDGDQDIIKCGTCSGESGSNRTINLGFEPQWIMTKSDAAGDWRIMDTMRGLPASGTGVSVTANTNADEGSDDTLHITSTGFYVNGLPGSDDYTFVAIRRGGMQTPTAASDVFAIDTYGGTSPTPPLFNSDFPTDMAFYKHKGNTTDFVIGTRITGPQYLKTNADSAEATLTNLKWDFQNGYFNATGTISDYVSWMWKRARGFFDVVTYTGNDSNRTISHNLGVAPEMMWVKDRGRTQNWAVYHANNTSEPATDRLRLNADQATVDDNAYWNDTAPTSSVFSVGTDGDVNTSGENYIAYLFASVSDVSKVGSYTGNSSSSQNIDCGFTTAGVEFLLIKSTSSGDWYIWDRTRGINSGNDPYLRLNNSAAETTNTDHIDTFTTGFTVNSDFNTENEAYIFYAIARG